MTAFEFVTEGNFIRLEILSICVIQYWRMMKQNIECAQMAIRTKEIQNHGRWSTVWMVKWCVKRRTTHEEKGTHSRLTNAMFLCARHKWTKCANQDFDHSYLSFFRQIIMIFGILSGRISVDNRNVLVCGVTWTLNSLSSYGALKNINIFFIACGTVQSVRT